MIKIKPKKCKGTGVAGGHGCGKETIHRTHGLGMSCCYANWLLNSEKGREKLNRATIKVTKPRMDLEKAETEKKDRTKLSYLLTNVKNTCHEYVRTRDKGKNCISCNTLWNSDFQAGHFFKAELFSTLKFDEYNINGQCRGCNLFSDGNESGYRVGILNRFGKEILDYLDELAQLEKQKTHQWSREQLEFIRQEYKEKLKSLK